MAYRQQSYHRWSVQSAQLLCHITVSHIAGFASAVLQKILGLDIVWKNADSIPAERHVLVSNHVTAGDLMVLYSLPQHYVHLISAQLPKRISQVQSYSTLTACTTCKGGLRTLSRPRSGGPLYIVLQPCDQAYVSCPFPNLHVHLQNDK